MFPLLIREFNEISKLINIIDIFRNFKEISDSNASTGRALQLNISGKMMISHFYHSIMPGRYEIFWRLRFMSRLIPGELINLSIWIWKLRIIFFRWELRIHRCTSIWSDDTRTHLEQTICWMLKKIRQELFSSINGYYYSVQAMYCICWLCWFYTMATKNDFCIGLYRDDCSDLIELPHVCVIVFLNK